METLVFAENCYIRIVWDKGASEHLELLNIVKSLFETVS